MNTFWWVALVAVVLLALVVTVSDGLGRGGRGPRRPGGRTRPPGRPAGPRRGREPRPEPGEIWWARVPFEDGPGSKDRPCLVLSVRGGTAVVAKITTRHHEERSGVIALPAGTVGDARARRSFLETDELREVAVREFRRRVGTVDPGVWAKVRDLG